MRIRNRRSLPRQAFAFMDQLAVREFIAGDGGKTDDRARALGHFHGRGLASEIGLHPAGVGGGNRDAFVRQRFRLDQRQHVESGFRG